MLALESEKLLLQQWMEQTDDPLLAGHVPPSPGAAVSHPTDVSPRDVWAYTERREGLAERRRGYAEPAEDRAGAGLGAVAAQHLEAVAQLAVGRGRLLQGGILG